MGLGKNHFLEASKKRREDRHRLTEFNIREVSVVDRAANGRNFLVIKQEDGMGNSATKSNAGAPNTSTADDDHFGADPIEASQLEKSQVIASPVKAATLAVTTEAIERVMRLAKAIRAATIKEDGGDNPLSPVIGRELRSISGLLKSLTSQFPVAAPADDATDTEKAKTKQKCPPNMVYDEDKGRCVFGKKSDQKKALTADQKSAIDAQLSDVIAKANALKETVSKAATTDDDEAALLDDAFGAELMALATRIGFISGVAPSQTAKSFALVSLDCEADAIEKAAATLTMTTAQRDAAVSEVEKAMDLLVETLRGVDNMREADVETGPLPDFVANAYGQAGADLLKVDADYTEKGDEGGDDDEEEGADSSDSADGGDGDGAASDDDKTGEGGDSSEGDAAADAGGDSDAGDGAADGGAEAGADADAVAKAVQAGVEKALAAQKKKDDERHEQTQKVVEDLVAKVSKLAGETPAPNGGQPGDHAPAPVTKSEGFDAPHTGDFDEEEIAELKKRGEWF